jgi:basic membrane lipoprotein Med (substrate-binding protein (PBP1-ABC) superfamily)
MIGMLKRKWWLVAAVVALAIVLAALLWPRSTPGRVLPPTRQRAYSAWRACLVTGSEGLADPVVAPVWAGMQTASARTTAQVTFLAAAGDGSVGAAEPYVASLATGHCGLIVAVGSAQIQAVASLAPRFAAVRFAEVGSGQTAANVAVIPAGSDQSESAAVAAAVENAYGH